MSVEFLMRPKVDFAFKEIMQDSNARLGFLSAVLGIQPKDIKETRILNTYLRKRHKKDKQGILDVRIILNNNIDIDIEIQVARIKAWSERSMLYLAKMFAEQLEEGEDYDKLKKCVSISILDFTLFKGRDRFYSCYHVREDTDNSLMSDKLEFHVIELTKLPRDLTEKGNTVLAWAKFISAERKEDFEMLARQSEYIKSAYRQLQAISRNKKKRLEYIERVKSQRDYKQMLDDAKTEGKIEGKMEGKIEGKIEGKEEERAKIIIQLTKNFTAEQIASMLDKPIDYVKNVIEKNKR